MAWSTTWEDKSLSPHDQIIRLAKECYQQGEDWEAQARVRFEYDYKFANGDTHNKYQWDNDIVQKRELESRPILTVNKTQQHNLMIINDAKQNKPGVRIRPVGDEATFEASQIFQELIYHIEYISSAENIYDSAVTWQVEAGIGYWRVITDYVDNTSFDQEIYIKHIKDPRSVYLDPDINEPDGSDARWGIIFEDMPTKLYRAKYPKFADVGSSTLNSNVDGWISKDHVRIAEFYVKEDKEDLLVAFVNPQGEQEIGKYSDLTPEGKAYYQSVKKLPTSKERKIVGNEIKWYKIAGDKIIDEGEWLGKYIPIVRLPGTETVIDGILDRKGHTRALINAQQMYNYNTSANIEFGALQTKAPWIAASAAIEGYEEYYKTANSQNHAYIPYNHIDEDGNVIPPPSRPQPPMPSPAYVEGLKIAQEEMMMASGQWQAQLGENENAKSGVAINARQRQGDRATYHFLDNQAIAIRYTGKILIDLIPKVYDTPRIKQILARDGTKKQIKIDPNAEQPHQQLENLNQDQDITQQIEQYVFNPTIGIYDIQADTGPSYATRRMEAFNALTLIASQQKDFMNIAGDLYFKVADFPEAEILAERYRRIIPPNITGDSPDPQTEQLMHQASDKIQQLTAQLQDALKKLDDKDRELTVKENELTLKASTETISQMRADYEALSKRITALGNSGPAISMEQITPLVQQAIGEALKAGGPYPDENNQSPAPHQGGTPIMLPEAPEGQETASGEEEEAPPMEGARKAPDGNWYVPHGNGFARVEATNAA